jgi:hypothetical protein
MHATDEPVLPLLFLLGRPASGKSELIDYMESTPVAERAGRYRIGRMRVIDDFPVLWRLFLEDDAREREGQGRCYSRRVGENYCVADDRVWTLLTEALGREASAALAERDAQETVLVEFSRGRVCGYHETLGGLLPRLGCAGAILYVDVSFEESWRRNVARYDERRKEGILTHSVPRDEMERSYAEDDWRVIAPEASGAVDLAGCQVPFVRMGNEPELVQREALDRRYHAALERLYRLWAATGTEAPR